MANIIIAGGTGLIGRTLSRLLLERGDRVYILTTQKNKISVTANLYFIYWQPRDGKIDTDHLPADCSIINLAGAGIAERRWTASRKAEILNSRIQSLQILYNTVASKKLEIKQLISASAIGFYPGNEKLHVESDQPGDGFLSQLCWQWEKEALRFRELDLPVSIVRVGIVLSTEGGALKEFLKTLRFGLAAVPGSGMQVMSWIHIEDLCRILIDLHDANASGIYNAVAPNPVSLDRLFEGLLKIKKGIKVKVPAWVIKIMLGEMGAEILKSINVSSRKIEGTGFVFKYEQVDEALKNLLGKAKNCT